MDATEELNRNLTRDWFERVWNERKIEVIEELMAEDGQAHGLGPDPIPREGFKALWHQFLETLPDLYVTVEDVLAQGDFTAVRIHLSGTHSGRAFGVEPSGKSVGFEAQTFVRWRNGQIIEAWNIVDVGALYRQIGAVVSLGA